MAKRVAVLGSTGMAGHVVAQYLEEQGYDVYRASRSEKKTAKSEPVDAGDFPALSGWLERVKPEVLINCIGLLQKACEEFPARAVLINAYLPKWMEEKYKDSGTKIIHLSTDCVFSGERGGYTERDLPDGRTMYDRSKALGEIDNGKDLTFRMSIIGPDIDEKGTGLFHWFMQQSGEISGYRRAIWNGVTTVELARAIDAAIRENLCGLYQLAAEEPIDKYHLLLLCKESFHKDISIVPADSVVLDKSLRNTRTDFPFTIRSYPEQINDMALWVARHPGFYPKYR